MAGPVQTYLATQLAAQTAFNVPFGLLSLVNVAIATATAAGEFNTTVDCSLFVTEDVSNLRIYLDSLGYKVEFAKNTNEKSLLIDWGEPAALQGDEVIADQGAPGTKPWPVVNEPSTDATITSVMVTTSSTPLLASNLNRKGIIIQSMNSPLYVVLGSTAASTSVYSYYVLKLNALEIENFFGPVSAVVATGTASVQVTEKI
jgi:hypothetical protein